MNFNLYTPNRNSTYPRPSDHNSSTFHDLTVNHVTVLKSTNHPVNKLFFKGKDGEVEKKSYQNPFEFNVTALDIRGIKDLYRIIQNYAPTGQHILIRGLPRPDLQQQNVRRIEKNFPEHTQGSHWVMLDFDDITVPEGIDPLSITAIEGVIARLPSEFHNTSYIYQHSNSAGILRADGTPMKSGLNAHLFFWLNRPVPGKKLAAYLRQHCLDTNFYSIAENKGGIPEIRYGVDPATIRSAVQPHFIAAPHIKSGVMCQLDEANRQGLVSKNNCEVVIASIPDDVEVTAKAMHNQVRTRYQREHGYIKHISEVVTKDGVSRKSYFINPDRTVRGGRQFLRGELNEDQTYFRLYFNDEGSPGSWYVLNRSPQLARRFGDGETMALRELSEGAYAYVRDELRWFVEIPHKSLALTEEGYLPAITTFATAKLSLILAPTGSGKTHATITWIKARRFEKLCMVYAAPTIALVNQMMADLKQEHLQPIRYTEACFGNISPSSIIVTTNESLPKMLELISQANCDHMLILDEFHQTLDGFLTSNSKNTFFESALLKAQKALFLTGTLTEIQRRKLPELVRHALGSVTETNYCCYEFKAVKSNPLHVLPLIRFDSDLVGLLEGLKAKLDSKQPLPRTVLLLPTSKLEAYRQMISAYGLADYSEIVSRPDNTQAEIETARTSTKPILISSPLFSLGLNFEVEPEILWCRFDHMQSDTNQIIQTVNRANRGQVRCEVRVYGNLQDNAVFTYANPQEIKAEITEQFRDEASIAGDLDDHLQLDRVTYQNLRKNEKNSLTALSFLVRENAIQNYNVTPLTNLSPVDKEKAKITKEFRKKDRQRHAEEIDIRSKRYIGLAPEDCLYLHNRLIYEKQENHKLNDPKKERYFSNEEQAIIMGLCNFSDPRMAINVNINKIKRIFGEEIPWVSAQYERNSFTSWAAVEAEKTENLIDLVEKLNDLRAGVITAEGLSALLTRNKRLETAFLALALSDTEFTRLSKKFSTLNKERAVIRSKGSSKDRAEVTLSSLNFLRQLLEPIGISYGKTLSRGREVIDLRKPVVPTHWDLSKIQKNLLLQTARLKSLPLSQKVPIEDPEKFEHEKEVRLEICQSCIRFHQSCCAVGHPVDWQGGGWEGHLTDQCNDFKRIPVKLLH